MKRNSVPFLTVFTLMLISLSVFPGCKSSANPSETHDVLGTTVTVTVYDPGAQRGDLIKVFHDVFQLMQDFDKKTLIPGPDNQVTKISSGAGSQSIGTDGVVFDMLMKAMQMYDASGQVFDIRYGPMLDLWNFGRNPRVPSPAELDSAKKLVAEGGMFVAGNSILLGKKAMRFDVREIAVGYAFDLAAAKLAEHGIRTAMISSPRVCRTMGDPPDPQGFPISLFNPLDKKPSWAVVHVPVGGTAYTSAAIDRFQNANKYYHSILDPRTGMSADRCAGAVVQAPDAITAQALAYAVFVFGGTDSLAKEGKSAAGGMIIVKDQNGQFAITASGSLQNRFEISK
ncbi:hypothetical protein EHM69_08290 [candidate division KSB1 bacterium]|nr:MAG: hypothetical protein EHM69_08290 [candidate division KSB1 bacterium]